MRDIGHCLLCQTAIAAGGEDIEVAIIGPDAHPTCTVDGTASSPCVERLTVLSRSTAPRPGEV